MSDPQQELNNAASTVTTAYKKGVGATEGLIGQVDKAGNLIDSAGNTIVNAGKKAGRGISYITGDGAARDLTGGVADALNSVIAPLRPIGGLGDVLAGAQADLAASRQATADASRRRASFFSGAGYNTARDTYGTGLLARQALLGDRRSLG